MTVQAIPSPRRALRNLAVLAAFSMLAVPVPAAAQDSSGCGDQAATAVPSTPPAAGDGSGTNPGASGSTGWTGGTGGSQIGTTHAGPAPGSPNEHPKTAQGVNPVRTPADTASGSRPSC